MLQRAQNQNLARNTYNNLIRRISFTLKTGVALRKSSMYRPPNADAVNNGNAMLLDCLNDDRANDPNRCTHLPPPPYQVALQQIGVPLQEQDDRRRFVLLDAFGNIAHPNTTGYWTLDGRLCDGKTGNPAFSPGLCPFKTSVMYTAYCSPSDPSNATAACTQAMAFKFYFTVEIADGVKVPGVTNPPKYDSMASDPITYSVAEMLRMSFAKAGDCDYARGYSVSGIDSNGNVTCAKTMAQKTVMAVHSMSSSPPSCAFNVRRSGEMTDTRTTFNSLLPAGQQQNYRSFAGVWMGYMTGSPADLGKPESCKLISDSLMSSIGTQSSSNWPLVCDGSGDNWNCKNMVSGTYSMWMRAIDTNTPQDHLPRSLINMMPFMSRCDVCEIDGPVMVVHDFNAQHSDTPPNCPSGWDRLYTGRSAGAFSEAAYQAESTGDGDGGYNSPQDLSSPGSCLPLPLGRVMDAVPFLECRHFATGSSANDQAQCLYRTPGDRSLWFTKSVGTAYRCSVCYKSPKINVVSAP